MVNSRHHWRIPRGSRGFQDERHRGCYKFCMKQGRHHLLLLLFGGLAALPSAAETPLTPIAVVRALSREKLAKAPPVRLRGVVTFRGIDTFVMQDDSAGIYINQGLARQRKIWAGDEAVFAALRPGSVVEVEGVMDPGGYSPPVLLRQVRILGEAPLPPALLMVPRRFFRGVEDSQRVEVRGVVQGFWADAEIVNLVLDANPGRFLAPCQSRRWTLRWRGWMPRCAWKE